MSSAALIAFTERGCRLAVRIADALAGEVKGKPCEKGREGRELAKGRPEVERELAKGRLSVSGPKRYSDELGISAYSTLESWTADAFAQAGSLVFVGACGIAVRAIAPYVRDKFSDPAVVAVDELGRVAVPLLSGHVGGANDLAREVAAVTGGIAAISTATDLNGRFAIDEFARDAGFSVVERSLAKEISSALLEGHPVAFGDGLGAMVAKDCVPQPFERTLHLIPQVRVGVGCRRGTDCGVLAQAVDRALAQAGYVPTAVGVLATIDLKADEKAILMLAARRGWRLETFTADELSQVDGNFSSSDFVREAVGVDNVCERAACANGAALVVGKQSGDGVTVAIAVSNRRSHG